MQEVVATIKGAKCTESRILLRYLLNQTSRNIPEYHAMAWAIICQAMPSKRFTHIYTIPFYQNPQIQ